MEAKTEEILNTLTMRLYGKRYDEITEEEKQDLRARLDKLMWGDDDE